MLSPEPEFLKILESIYMLSYIYAKSNKKFRPCGAILYMAGFFYRGRCNLKIVQI